MSKVLEPYILMEWILSDGKSYTFELSVSRFHKLKHTIAKVILEIQRLELYNVIKTTNS